MYGIMPVDVKIKMNEKTPYNIVQISGLRLVVRGRRVHARFSSSFGQEMARNPPQKLALNRWRAL